MHFSPQRNIFSNALKIVPLPLPFYHNIGNNNNSINANNNVLNSSNNKEQHNATPTIGNGGGSVGSVTDKESLTPSPSANDDVKSEPMELICGNNVDGDQSNDSINDQVINRSGSASEAKACAR